MAHPFEKMFERALRKSTPEENLVAKEAQSLLEKGYREEEVLGVLKHLRASLIQDEDMEVVKEAIELVEEI